MSSDATATAYIGLCMPCGVVCKICMNSVLSGYAEEDTMQFTDNLPAI